MTIGAALAVMLTCMAPAFAETASGANEGSELRESLRLECLNEAEWSTRERNKKVWFREHNTAVHQPPTDETIRLKNLCREMNELPSGGEVRHAQIDLAAQCAKAIHVGIKDNVNTNNVRHFEHMRRICEQMTGADIPE